MAWCGIMTTIKKNEVMHVTALACSCDYPARAMVLNFKQFHGKYGCSYCLNSGELLEGTVTRVYQFTGETELRNHAQSVNYANMECAKTEEHAQTTDCSEFGVKGVSELYRVFL